MNNLEFLIRKAPETDKVGFVKRMFEKYLGRCWRNEKFEGEEGRAKLEDFLLKFLMADRGYEVLLFDVDDVVTCAGVDGVLGVVTRVDPWVDSVEVLFMDGHKEYVKCKDLTKAEIPDKFLELAKARVLNEVTFSCPLAKEAANGR